MSGSPRQRNRTRRRSMMPLARTTSFADAISKRNSTPSRTPTTSSLPDDQRSDHSNSNSSFTSKSSTASRRNRDNGVAPPQNILVTVRVRPGLPSEPPAIHEHLHDVAKEGPLSADDKKLAYDTENQCVSGRKDYDVVPHTYTYDSLFGPNATNPIVYKGAVKPVVDSVSALLFYLDFCYLVY
jgi:hypothetical protein